MAHRDDPRTRYELELDRLEAVTGGAPDDTDGPGKLRGDVSETDAEEIREVLEALDGENRRSVFTHDGETVTHQPKTLSNYATRLRLAATEADGDLQEQTTDDVNDMMADMADGRAEIAPSDGYTDGTVGQYQSALIAFYRYYDDHDVDPEAIHVYAPEETTVDERDMFSPEEVQAMREAIDSPRERCLFELLAYSGQRIRAIQTLRVKDVDLDQGVFYLNENEDGLKDSKGKRPLLGAAEYVRRWLDYHPTGEPEDFLITPKPTGGGQPGGKLTQDTIRYHLRKYADKADVSKDVNPHVFRHYFTTIAKRDYGMDDAYIKHLRGDAPGSNVMETTYRHLSDDDAIDHAKEATGQKEPEPQPSLSPDACPTCGELLEPDAKACGRCGAVFTPDAQEAQKQVQQDMGASKALADGEELTDDDLAEIADDDAILSKLIEIRSEG